MKSWVAGMKSWVQGYEVVGREHDRVVSIDECDPEVLRESPRADLTPHYRAPPLHRWRGGFVRRQVENHL